jgi:hypothetical protein
MAYDIEAGWLISSFILGGMFGVTIGLLIAAMFARRQFRLEI